MLGCGTSMLDAKTRGWVVVETADLRVRSDARPARAVELAVRYQRMHDAIAEHELPCGFDRLTAPLEVTLYEQSGEQSFHRPPQTSFLGLQAQIVVHTAARSESLGLFTHELTHRLLAVCFPTATIWLHEGMAGFYQTARLHEDTLELGFPLYVFMPRSHWAGPIEIYQTEVNGEQVPVLADSIVLGAQELRAMTQSEFYAADPTQRFIHYAGAWALVHLLKLGDLSLSPPFVRYLEALHAGTEEAAAWEAAFGDRDIEARYAAYLKEDPFARVRTMNVPEPEGLVARPMPSGEAALMLAQLENWEDDKGAKRAEAYIDFAADQASTWDDAMLLRGAFLNARGDRAGAQRSMEQALERDGANPDALAAMLQLQISDDVRVEGISGQAARWLRRLEHSATSSYHFAVAAWWRTYALRDVQGGVALAERAIELDGTNIMAYVNLADGAAFMGQTQRALGAYLAALALSRYRGGEAREYLEGRVSATREELEGAGPAVEQP